MSAIWFDGSFRSVGILQRQQKKRKKGKIIMESSEIIMRVKVVQGKIKDRQRERESKIEKVESQKAAL